MGKGLQHDFSSYALCVYLACEGARASMNMRHATYKNNPETEHMDTRVSAGAAQDAARPPHTASPAPGSCAASAAAASNDDYALNVAARLDRLPYSRTAKRFVLLISIGAIFELYDLFMTAYIAPGLVKSGLFATSSLHFFGLSGVGFSCSARSPGCSSVR
jgi:hypothetical protein